MIYAVTGHRPEKTGGYNEHAATRRRDLAHNALATHRPNLVYTGMAQGWDMAIAETCCLLNIPFVAAVPFEGQESRWPKETQVHYHSLLAQAERVVYVCEPGYAAWKMQKRNEYMVDNTQRILALWNGSPGGTANCIAYAEKQGKPVINLWQSWQRYH